jgi:hypothetical protein
MSEQINLALMCRKSKHFGEFCEKANDATANPIEYLRKERQNQIALANIKNKLGQGESVV